MFIMCKDNFIVSHVKSHQTVNYKYRQFIICQFYLKIFVNNDDDDDHDSKISALQTHLGFT